MVPAPIPWWVVASVELACGVVVVAGICLIWFWANSNVVHSGYVQTYDLGKDRWMCIGKIVGVCWK